MLKQWQAEYDAAYSPQPLDLNHMFGCLFDHFAAWQAVRMCTHLRDFACWEIPDLK